MFLLYHCIFQALSRYSSKIHGILKYFYKYNVKSNKIPKSICLITFMYLTISEKMSDLYWLKIDSVYLFEKKCDLTEKSCTKKKQARNKSYQTEKPRGPRNLKGWKGWIFLICVLLLEQISLRCVHCGYSPISLVMLIWVNKWCIHFELTNLIHF